MELQTRYLKTSAIKFASPNNILLVASWTNIMASQPLFQNTYVLIKLVVVNFTDIMKIANILIRKAFIDPIEVKKKIIY